MTECRLTSSDPCYWFSATEMACTILLTEQRCAGGPDQVPAAVLHYYHVLRVVLHYWAVTWGRTKIKAGGTCSARLVTPGCYVWFTDDGIDILNQTLRYNT